MKKRFLLTVLCLIPFGISAQGFDLGLNLESTTSYINSDDQFLQQGIKASPYFLLKGENWQLGAKGSFSTLIQKNFTTTVDTNIYWCELDSLVYNLISGKEGEGKTSFSVGRIKFQDSTGEVINQTLDGLRFGLSQNNWSANFSAGYNGLQYKKTGMMALNSIDLAEMYAKDVYLASPRAVAMAEAQIRDLGPSTLNISLLYQQDLRNIVSPGSLKKAGDPVAGSSGAGAYNSQFLVFDSTIQADNSLFANIYTAGMLSQGLYKTTEYKDFLGTALMAGASLSYFFSEGLQNIKAGIQYSTGNSTTEDALTDGTSHLFRPLTVSDQGIIFNPSAGNLILGSLQYSIKPFSNTGGIQDRLQLLLKGTTFFRSTFGPKSDTAAKPVSERLYLGSEIDCLINVKLFSDFGISVTNGLFFPDTSSGGAFEGSNWINFKSNLYISMSF